MTNYNYDYIRDDFERNCLKKLDRNYKREEPLRVEIIKDGIILPQKSTYNTDLSYIWMGVGGILNNGGEFVKLSGIPGFGENEGRMVFGGKYKYDRIEEFLDEDVLYMGAYQPHWGHFLLEYCTRLWYYVKFKPNIRIAFCGFHCESNSISGNFLDFLGLLGIKREQLIDIRKVTKIRKIIVPEQSFLRDKYFTDEYRMMIDFAYQNIGELNVVPYNKIYFTRINYANEKERGEREIRDIFKENGYTCLAPENLSVAEQMFYVRNCKEFVVIPGGSSMNGVFAAYNTKRIYLKKAYLPELPGDVFQIDQMTQASWGIFVDCYFKPYKSLPIGYGGGPHFMGVTKELKSFLRTNNYRQASHNKHYIAIVKNWIWLTKIVLRNYFHNKKDKLIYSRMKFKIERLIVLRGGKVIIYPCGKWGNMVKSILKEKVDVDCIMVDHYKCYIDEKIQDIDALDDEQYSDYVILLCSDKDGKYYEAIRSTVYNKVNNKKRIVEIL